MKSFRYQLASLMMALILGLSLTACDDDSQAQTYDNQQLPTQHQTIVNVPEINKEVKDSLDKYTARIDSISKDTKAAIDDVASMNGKVSNLKDNEKWWWASCGIGIIALILSIISLIRCNYLNKRLNRHRDEIQELKREKQSASFAPKTVSKSSIPSDYDFLKRRVYDLEIQLRQLTIVPSQPQSYTEPVIKPVVKDNIKTGYFGNPINAAEPYFKKMLVSRDSEARFSADISGNKAVFKPLDSSSYLGTFVSNDAMRAAVDFKGCAPSEASSMQVITPGEAEQRDNKWVITKKATVYLS